MKICKHKIKKMVAIAAVSGGLLGSANAAFASPGEGWGGCDHRGMGQKGMMRGGPMNGPMGGPMGRMGHMGHGMNMSKHIDGRLAFMKTELKITPEQEAVWQEYEKTMREMASEQEAMFKNRGEMRKSHRELPLDQRIDQRMAMMDRRTAHMKKMATAFKKLYGQLTEDQRKTAETLPMARFM